MRRFHWYHCALLLLLIPRVASAIQLQWSSGADSLTFTDAARCTLVLQASPGEVTLPPEWHLQWVADSCDISFAPQPCEVDVAQMANVTSPLSLAAAVANQLDAQFCSSGSQAAPTAWYVLDITAGGAGKFKAVALDPSDLDSRRVLQSQVVSFNGGTEKAFPPLILRTARVHESTDYELTVIGVGLQEASEVRLVAPSWSWDLPLSVSSSSDTALVATAAIAASVPDVVVQVNGLAGAVAAAPVEADPPPPPLEPQAGCQENFIEDIYPPDTIQPKDFSFVPGGWTASGSWTFHLFYIRQNQFTKMYHGGVDFTEKNIGHAVTNDLSTWTVLDTAALEVRSGRFDSEHVWAPHIVRRGLTYHMFYTGVDDNGDQRIGLASSTDLVNWVQGDSVFEVSQVPWADPDPPDPYFGKTQLRDAFVMEDPATPGDWLMYFVTVAQDYTPGMVTGYARSDGDFASWANTAPLWSTLHRWPSATEGRIESAHLFPRYGDWWLFYTANGDTVYGVSNATGPSDTVTANWSQAQKLRALVPPSEATAYNFWHATEYLEISASNGIGHLAAFNDANESISYTQMGDASPYLFTGLCPSVLGVDDAVASLVAPRLVLSGRSPARSMVGLRLELPKPARVRVAVYDVLGRLVKTLVDEELPAGAMEFAWDGHDTSGALVGSGVYFATLIAEGHRAFVRVPLIR